MANGMIITISSNEIRNKWQENGILWHFIHMIYIGNERCKVCIKHKAFVHILKVICWLVVYAIWCCYRCLI